MLNEELNANFIQAVRNSPNYTAILNMAETDAFKMFVDKLAEEMFFSGFIQANSIHEKNNAKNAQIIAIRSSREDGLASAECVEMYLRSFDEQPWRIVRIALGSGLWAGLGEAFVNCPVDSSILIVTECKDSTFRTMVSQRNMIALQGCFMKANRVQGIGYILKKVAK